MKKLFSILAIISLFSLGLNAQEQGDLGANFGLAYGTQSGINDDGEEGGGIGLNVGLEYFATDQISIAPSFTYFFKDEIDEPGISASINLSAINIDGRYYFLTDDIRVYGLIGPSIVMARSEVTVEFFGTTETSEDTDSEFGINIGGGIVYPLSDNLGINAQIKYQSPYDGQLVLNGGISYLF